MNKAMIDNKIVHSVRMLRRAIEAIDVVAIQVNLVDGNIPINADNADLCLDVQNLETLVGMLQRDLLNKITSLEGLIKEHRSGEHQEEHSSVA